MQETRRGAEAVLMFADGRAIKERTPKAYRHADLDTRLRKKRTKMEASFLRQAKRAGVPVPAVLEESETTLVLEYIKGVLVKDYLSKETLDAVCTQIGENLAKIHQFEIIHGDLTTSNMVVSQNRVFFIDFGLSYRSTKAEDRATDLYVLRQTLVSTHHEIFEEAWKKILAAYATAGTDSDKVIKTLRKIEKRRRYTQKE